MKRPTEKLINLFMSLTAPGEKVNFYGVDGSYIRINATNSNNERWDYYFTVRMIEKMILEKESSPRVYKLVNKTLVELKII